MYQHISSTVEDVSKYVIYSGVSKYVRNSGRCIEIYHVRPRTRPNLGGDLEREEREREREHEVKLTAEKLSHIGASVLQCPHL